jgi:hypothetical protein
MNLLLLICRQEIFSEQDSERILCDNYVLGLVLHYVSLESTYVHAHTVDCVKASCIALCNTLVLIAREFRCAC